MVVISASTEEKLLQMCKDFFYSENISISLSDKAVSNKNGIIKGYSVGKIKGRFKLVEHG